MFWMFTYLSREARMNFGVGLLGNSGAPGVSCSPTIASSDSDNEHEVSESDLPDGGQTSSPDTSEGETSGSRNR